MRLSKKNKILFSSVATLLAISFCLLSVAIFFNFKNKDSFQVKADVATYSFDGKIEYKFFDNDPNNQDSTNTSIAANGIDGNILPGETYNNTQVFTINSRNGWILFAISCSRFDYNGKTVKLTNDVDCKGDYIVPVGHSADNFDFYNKQYYWSNLFGWFKTFTNFNGTFDGQGHVIKDFKLRCARYDSDEPACGLFLQLGPNAIIKNLKIQDAVYNIMPNEYGYEWPGPTAVGAIAGFADVGSQISSCWVQNVSVLLYSRSNSELYNHIVGGILGRTSGRNDNNKKVYINDCVVEDFKLFREYDGEKGNEPYIDELSITRRVGTFDLYGICFEGATDIGGQDIWISITNCLVKNLEIHNLTQFLYNTLHSLDETACENYGEMYNDFRNNPEVTNIPNNKLILIDICPCTKITNSEKSGGCYYKYYEGKENDNYENYFYNYSYGDKGVSNCRAVSGEPYGWSYSGTGGTNGKTWYYNKDYNSGWPMLRVFMSFQEFRFDTDSDGSYNTSVFVPNKYGEYGETDFVANAVKYIEDYKNKNNLSIMGSNIRANNPMGSFKSWEKTGDYQYKAVYTFEYLTIYFDIDQNGDSDYLISVGLTQQYLDEVNAQLALEFGEVFNRYWYWVTDKKDGVYISQKSILDQESINAFHAYVTELKKNGDDLWMDCTLSNGEYVLGNHAKFTIYKIENNTTKEVDSVELLSEKRGNQYLVGTTGIKYCGTTGFSSASTQSAVVSPQGSVVQPEVPGDQDTKTIYYYQSEVEYLSFSINFSYNANDGGDTISSIKTNYKNIKDLYNQVTKNLKDFNMTLFGKFYVVRDDNGYVYYYYGYKPNLNILSISESFTVAGGNSLSDFGRWNELNTHNGWVDGCVDADEEWMPNSGNTTPRDYNFELERLKSLYFYTSGDTTSKYPNYLQFLTSEYATKVAEFKTTYLNTPSFIIYSEYVNNSIITAQKPGYRFTNWEFVKNESGCEYYKANFILQKYTIVFNKTQIANSGYYTKCFVEQNGAKTEFLDRVQITAYYKSTISVSVDYDSNSYIYTVKNQDGTLVAKISYVLGTNVTDEEWKYTVEKFRLPVAVSGSVYDSNVIDESEYNRDDNISITLCMNTNQDGSDPVVNITPTFRLKTYEIKS